MSVDPQFVIVTLAALWGAWILLRPLARAGREKKPASGAGACGRCSSPACSAPPGPGDGPKLVSLGSGKKSS
jgi:hypothetical protein